MIATKAGISIRFDEKQVRPMGRATVGVKGIELDDGDEVVGLCVASTEEDRVLAVCERGYGKQTPLGDFRLQSRGGKGVILINTSDRNGPVVGIAVSPEHEVLLVTDQGQMRAIEVLDPAQDPSSTASSPPPSTPPDSGDVRSSAEPPAPEPDDDGTRSPSKDPSKNGSGS